MSGQPNDNLGNPAPPATLGTSTPVGTTFRELRDAADHIEQQYQLVKRQRDAKRRAFADAIAAAGGPVIDATPDAMFSYRRGPDGDLLIEHAFPLESVAPPPRPPNPPAPASHW